jgi:MFS family permease
MTAQTTPGHGPRLSALALAMLLPSLGTSIANVALPAVRVAFASTSQDVQWVVIAYLLAVTSLVLAAGRLGDLWGRRRLLLAGIAIFTLASGAGAIAPGLWPLVAARGVQGVGAALMMAMTVAMVGDLVPNERTGRAMGLLGTVSAVGTALGPSLGGALVSSLGWRAVFVAMGLAGVAALATVHRVLPPAPRSDRLRPALDVPGVVLLAVSLGAYALSTTLDAGWNVRAVLALGSALGLAAFVAVELRSAAPLIQLRLLRDRELATGLVALGLVSAILMATLVVGPFYLTGTLNLGPLATGLVMTVGPGVAALTGVPAGRLIDRLGAPAAALAGLGGVLLGSALMTWLPGTCGVTNYVASLALLTMGYALFQAANATAVMGAASADRRGVTSAMLALVRNLGLVTGASAMGALFALGSQGAGSAGPQGDGEAGLRLTFTVAVGLAALALAATGWGHGRGGPARTGEDAQGDGPAR